MYNSLPTICFGRFRTGHHQVGYNVGGTTYLLKYSHWSQCQCGVRGGNRSPLQPTNNEHTMHAILL